ncbi:uncharacterized protein MYCFIDRAFT_176406 [Pseudocercospora fijiensis CIRAD86]|uniref:Uncharacterized protein n=1 Tax=Pseudocercospora fijiensis (strain CIRAD86) TaxID=383855 RepID=M3AV92_PSEFD|nr:uncharacterized protein MYCFIDRAFT_176406 [Pseudocercospora fijiensis CIRAD86]EME81078.1 hypothetical protein MYCFIDRAFT_176406 [Pseudocercospora fijiensis CIRAD86]
MHASEQMVGYHTHQLNSKKRSPKRYSTESVVVTSTCSCMRNLPEIEEEESDVRVEEILQEDPLIELLETFSGKEGVVDITKATWYAVAVCEVPDSACALAASSAGHEVVRLYRFATIGHPLETQKAIQRRIKEAIVKTSMLYGASKALQALYPLFKDLKEEEIDHYGPRWDTVKDDFDGALLRPKERQRAGAEFFGTLWGPDAARQNLEFTFNYCPDLYVQNIITLEWFVSEDGIFRPHETCMCTTAAIICSNSPVQAMWNTRGIVRQGGTLYQAKFTQQLALGIAGLYGAMTGKILPVEEIDFDDNRRFRSCWLHVPQHSTLNIDPFYLTRTFQCHTVVLSNHTTLKSVISESDTIHENHGNCKSVKKINFRKATL